MQEAPFMSLTSNVNEKANLIWAIADKLTGVYKPHEYGEVILPLTVIRRFDCILSDTKEAVRQKYAEVKDMPVKDFLLNSASGHSFYNTSRYTFEKLLDDPDNIEVNFRNFLNGFSPNVVEIIEKFKFDGHIATMANKGILYIVLKEFTTPKADLHPDKISNLEMGYIFEEIIRRFSEAHNEDAGQHYTPREVIELMVNILFHDDNEILSGANVVMPNLSPTVVRKKYELYDNKICTGEEAAECRFCLDRRVKKIGYELVVDRGDYKPDGL
jgi:type I restriction enzyme M protein